MIGHDSGVLLGAKVRHFAVYWESRRREGGLPARADLDPADFVYCLPNILLMDLSHDPLRVRYRLVGSAVVATSRLDFTGRYLDELAFPNPHFDWIEVYRRLVADRRPLFGSVPIESSGGEKFYDLGLFPLSSDGSIIDKAIAVEDYEPLGGRDELEKLASARMAASRRPEG
jgi:hypothetical protein